MGNFYYEYEWDRAYTKALVDVRNWMERHGDALKLNRLNNTKGMMRLMDAFIENRVLFEMYGEHLALKQMKDGSITVDGDGCEV